MSVKTGKTDENSLRISSHSVLIPGGNPRMSLPPVTKGFPSPPVLAEWWPPPKGMSASNPESVNITLYNKRGCAYPGLLVGPNTHTQILT